MMLLKDITISQGKICQNFIKNHKRFGLMSAYQKCMGWTSFYYWLLRISLFSWCLIYFPLHQISRYCFTHTFYSPNCPLVKLIPTSSFKNLLSQEFSSNISIWPYHCNTFFLKRFIGLFNRNLLPLLANEILSFVLTLHICLFLHYISLVWSHCLLYIFNSCSHIT